MLWLVFKLVIQMDKSPFHLLNRFELVLERLSNVVGDPKRHVRAENDVQLYHIVVAVMVGPDRVNRHNVGMMIASNESESL